MNLQVQRNVRQLFYISLAGKMRCAFATQAKPEVDKVKNNPYYEKYASKICEVLKNSPSTSEQITNESKESGLEREPLVKDLPLNISSVKESSKRKSASVTQPTKKTLDTVLKIDLVKDKTPEEIENIWKQYHSHKDMIYGVLPENTYDILHKNSVKHPVFVLPLPRNEGYEYFLCQFSDHEVHFTPLVSYHTHKENAVECLNMTHYTELKEDKHIVLMHGEYVPEVLNTQEAMCLVNQLQLYYCGHDDKKTKLLERFTNYPSEFKHIDLIAELHSLNL